MSDQNEIDIETMRRKYVLEVIDIIIIKPEPANVNSSEQAQSQINSSILEINSNFIRT